MFAIIAIWKKEMRIFFTTPLAYVVMAAFSTVSGFIFLRKLHFFHLNIQRYADLDPILLTQLNFSEAVLVRLLSDLAVVLNFIVPFITMRLIAEERRTHTFELLMVCPIRPLHIACGKYLAAISVLSIMLSVVVLYPLLVSTFAVTGQVEWTTFWVGLLGVYLLAFAYAGIGLFVSALTQSQIIAAFTTWCCLILLWLVGWAANDTSGITRQVMIAMSSVEHIRNFTRGMIDIHDVVYYLSLAVFGLFMTQRALESNSWR